MTVLTAAAIRVEVGVSTGLAVGLAGFVVACASALYVAAEAVAGPLAGVTAALAGGVVLVSCAWRQVLDVPRRFRLDKDGSLRWVERSGRPGRGRVTAAVRVGGGWVSLSVQAEAASGSRRWPGLCRYRRYAWLLAADAMAPDTFRRLALRIPRVTGGPS